MIIVQQLPPFTGKQATQATKIRAQSVEAFNVYLHKWQIEAQRKEAPDQELLQMGADYERLLIENLKQHLDADWWVQHPVQTLAWNMVPSDIPSHYIDRGSYNPKCAGQRLFEEVHVVVAALGSIRSEERMKRNRPVYEARRKDYEGSFGQSYHHTLELYEKGCSFSHIFAHHIAHLVSMMESDGLLHPSIQFLQAYMPEVEKEGLYPLPAQSEK